MNLELRKADAVISAILTERNPLPVEMLVEPHQRRATVEDHQRFRESIAAPRPFDEIDEAMAMPDPPSKRSERETSRVLSILDSLERGNG